MADRKESLTDTPFTTREAMLWFAYQEPIEYVPHRVCEYLGWDEARLKRFVRNGEKKGYFVVDGLHLMALNELHKVFHCAYRSVNWPID